MFYGMEWNVNFFKKKNLLKFRKKERKEEKKKTQKSLLPKNASGAGHTVGSNTASPDSRPTWFLLGPERETEAHSGAVPGPE